MSVNELSIKKITFIKRGANSFWAGHLVVQLQNEGSELRNNLDFEVRVLGNRDQTFSEIQGSILEEARRH